MELHVHNIFGRPPFKWSRGAPTTTGPRELTPPHPCPEQLWPDMSDTYNLIDAALKSVRDVYEQDTESTVKQLEAMRQVNTAATLRYIKKEEDLKKLSRKAKSVEQTSMWS